MKLTRSVVRLLSAALATSHCPISSPGSAQQAEVKPAFRTPKLSFYGATRI